MRLGVVILPEHPWREAREIWTRAEAMGFDHAWTYDHLAWRTLRDDPWFGAIPTLTAAAGVTSRIRIGPLVASPNFRHPVPFAKELMTLDDISEGRLTVGIGSGGTGWDATVMGAPAWSPRERAARFGEFVTLTDLLLREPQTSYSGDFYRADEARNYPGCVQRPRVPFAIAAMGPRAMQLVAKYGESWVTTGGVLGETKLASGEGAAVVRAQIDLLDHACAEAGRAADSVDRIVLSGVRLDSGLASPDAFEETIGRYGEAGVTDFVVHWPRSREPFAGNMGTFEKVLARVIA